MARRSEHSLEQIKEMILKAAESIVIEEGYAALTMRKIAMEIGYTVGSIYMVFSSMSDLVMHVNAGTLDEIASLLRPDPDKSAEHNIEELAKIYLCYASSHYNRWSMIFEHRLGKTDEVPDWYRQKIEEVFREFEAQFEKLAPSYPDDEIKRVARALWGGIHGICFLSLSGKLDIVGIADVEASVVLLVRNFVFGWKATL
ncbi:MAG: TetR/AcrR family transcriptional regulator [Gammaproteobacteria bacterium]